VPGLEAFEALQGFVWLAADELQLRALSVVIFLPLATAIGLVLTGGVASFAAQSDGLSGQTWKIAGLVGSTLTFFVAAFLLWNGFDAEQPGHQFVEHHTWLPELGIRYFVGLDGISLALVLLTTFLVPVVLLACWNDIDHSRRSWIFFVLALETGMLGAFASLNLFAFYVFWEAMMVPMYFIIGIWGGARRIYAALKFFLFTLFGSLLMLVAMLALVHLNFEQAGVLNFDLVAGPLGQGLPLIETVVPRLGEAPWWQTQRWLFLGFAIAFAIKVPLVPFHTWLPDAHVEAPTGGSAILAGVLLKMGTYGYLRFALPLFPTAALALLPWLLGVAALGIVYGSLLALVQQDVKKLVAYSSIAHLGFVSLGIFSLDLHGIVGSVVAMVSHGLVTGGLFLLVGFIYERRGTRELSALGGLAKPMPVYAAFFAVVVMASIGLPVSSGFVGEFLILLGSFATSPWAAAAAVLGVVLGAVYMLRLLGGLVFGPLDDPANRGLIDLSWRERSVLVALVSAIVWIGLYPEPLLRRIEPTAVELLATMRERGAVLPGDERSPPEAARGSVVDMARAEVVP